jgi:hypothetical protein
MDITDKDGLWRIKYHTIENRKTGKVRTVKNIPRASTIAYMTYAVFLKKCEAAFKTGVWPTDY